MADSPVLRDLIARALADADDGVLRGIVGELVRQKINDYDCREVIQATVTPLVQRISLDLVKDPQVVAGLEARVKQQLLTMLGSAELKVKDRY